MLRWENRAVICSLFYLLGVLSVDLVIDLSDDPNLQRTYYCALISSFSTITGLLRLLPAAVLLAYSSLAALYKSRGLSRKLHALTICILTAVGLPLFLNTARLVHSACPTLWFPTNAVLDYHYGILAVLLSSLSLEIAVCYLRPKSNIA